MADPNAPATPAALQNVEVKVAGRSNLYLADVNEPNVLYYFGEQMDDTPMIVREFYNDVPADSHGGPQGPPVDRQTLGRMIQINFNLSLWSQQVRYWLENQNGAYAESGTLQDYEIGALLFQAHAWRLLIVPLRGDPMNATPADRSEYFFTFNFPCALLSSPIETGMGTKFGALRFTLEAHRAPPGAVKRRVLWDRDVTGFVEPTMAAQRAAVHREHLARMGMGQSLPGGLQPPPGEANTAPAGPLPPVS